MKPKIKVCGITNAEDADLAIRLGADYIGVILHQSSPRAVEPSSLASIFEVVPVGRRVLVDVATPSDLMDGYRRLGFDFFQIHFPLATSMASLATWAGLVGRSRLWAAPKIPPEERHFPQILMQFADTFVFDTFHPKQFGGTGKTGNWQQFQDWSILYQHKTWVLAGGLGPDNILAAIEATGASILDVNSGVESSPGRKDPDKLTALFEAVSCS